MGMEDGNIQFIDEFKSNEHLDHGSKEIGAVVNEIENEIFPSHLLDENDFYDDKEYDEEENDNVNDTKYNESHQTLTDSLFKNSAALADSNQNEQQYNSSEEAMGQEVNQSFTVKENRSEVEQQSCQEERQVKRRIKIKVSVSQQDQVNCEDLSPVALGVSSNSLIHTQHTQSNIEEQSQVTSNVSGENFSEIPETTESPTHHLENVEANENLQKTSEPINKQTSQTQQENDNSKTDQTSDICSIHNAYNQEDNIYNDLISKDSLTFNGGSSSIELDSSPCDVQTAEGITSGVRMRPPLRKYSKKRTASYRWSGTDMVQIDGPPDLPRPEEGGDITIVKPDIERLNATRANISYKKACSGFEKKIKKLGFTRPPTLKEYPKDGDNCLKALIDQMSQPGQDFKVWDKDDYVFSVAKIFNKDIIVIESSNSPEEITFIKGGQNDVRGKGPPLILGHLGKEEAGNDFYQSLVPGENLDVDQVISSLVI